MKKKYRFRETNLANINFKRISLALNRRIKNIYYTLSWYYDRKNTVSIKKYKNSYMNKRCFILGNGPSLNKTDLSFLDNEITFGANRVYLLKEQTNFLPTFLVSVDSRLLDQFHGEIAQQAMPKFVAWNKKKHFKDSDNLSYLHINFKPKFSYDLMKPIWGGHTVTFVCLQLAYYMGFNEVYLIGVDHNYAEKGVPNTEIKVKEKDINHFSEKYYKKGDIFRIPDYSSQEYAYSLARIAFESSGRIIKDATIGGKLQIFEKVEYCSIFDVNV